MLLFLGTTLFSGCKETQPAEPEVKPATASSAQAFLERLAPVFGKTAKDIKPLAFSGVWIDGELNGYLLRNDALASTENIWDKIEQTFEGWVEKIQADGVWESYVEYLNDNLICSVYTKLNYDMDEVMNQVYLEEEDAAKKQEATEKLDKIYDESTRTIEVHCGEFTEKQPSPLEFTFDLFGEEPFWDASLRVDSLTYTLPNNETHAFETDNTYIGYWGTSGKNLIFSGEKYDLGVIEGELTKEACLDTTVGETHPYKARISFWDGTFEGCADKADNFLVPGRQGKLENLLKKINYKNYTGKLNPKTASYGGIQAEGNLVEVFLTQLGSEQTEYLVLGKTDKGRETYWQGTTPVDDATCEKYVNVPRLMDFWIFSSCPRG